MEKEELIQEIKNFIDEYAQGAKRTISSGKELSPELMVCFVNSEGRLEALETPGVEIFFRNNAMKDRLPDFIRDVFTTLRDKAESLPEMLRNPVAIVLISDAYLAHVPMNNRTAKEVIEEELPPSQRPDRTEALMFNCHLQDYSFMRTYPYTREGNNITFQDMEEIDGRGEGRFANLFPS